MIIGIGSDIVDIERIERLLNRHGERFIKRILHDEEIKLLETMSDHQRILSFIAGRFSAKEAVAKATGCGIGAMVGFHDIVILPNDKGRPQCKLSAQAIERLHYSPETIVHVTLSHSPTFAVAFAVVEQ